MLLEGLDLVEKDPGILRWIELDLEEAGLRKKKLRRADQQWALKHGVARLDFDEDEWQQTLVGEPLKLYEGRPRIMDAHCTYIFLLLRGYLGSTGSQAVRERMMDSALLQAYLDARGLDFPGESTIRENLNAISNLTRRRILTAQLEQVLDLKLDDFAALTVDSTTVRANSAWPTDSKLLIGLLNRVCRCGQQLSTFGLQNFCRHWTERWLDELAKIDFQIVMVLGKANSKKKIKKHYRKFLRTTQKLLEYFTKEFERLDKICSSIPLPPSQRRLLDRLWSGVRSDLSDVATVCSYTENRVFHDVVLPAPQKILSLSDRSAGFIKKGQREYVIGYNPQLSRSANGIITALVVSEGNTSDRSSLLPLVNQHIDRTGVTPESISTDDGYSSKANRTELFELGVEAVSMNGATGKKITPQHEWESELYQDLRCSRSAAESMMFTIKHSFHFGQLSRRGMESVEAEMLEKLIAHNLWRISYIKEKQRQAA